MFNTDPTTVERLQRIENMLCMISRDPQYSSNSNNGFRLKRTPATEAELELLAPLIPGSDLQLFMKIGFFELSYNDCLVHQTCLPQPVINDPFGYGETLLEEKERYLIFGGNTDSTFFGYDTDETPYQIVAWDLFGSIPFSRGKYSIIQISEEEVTHVISMLTLKPFTP